ncbi:MAG: response regulator [Candidatus Rokubacteria bacterium]|nr:response regulator [Candidatus Rokubacteria bacterium]
MGVEDRTAEPTTLLVVEDDPEMRSLLCDVLMGEGFRVLVESTGEQAMAVSESERLDVAIVDKEMPGLNGLDLLSFFRRRLPDVPVILITAFGGPRVAEEAFRRGAARYLEKPFRVTDLLAAIRSVTGKMRGSSTPEPRTQA